MPLDTQTRQQKKPKTSTISVDSEQTVSVEEQNSRSVPTDLESPTISKPRKQSTQKVEETLNIQLTEPTLHESVSMLTSPETDITERIENIRIEEETVGVKVPLDLGTPLIVPEEVVYRFIENIFFQFEHYYSNQKGNYKFQQTYFQLRNLHCPLSQITI